VKDETKKDKAKFRDETNVNTEMFCMELHGYVRPLLELLNGLKTGRYDRGLSTFQQSIAMDRLQRIVGILQKPPMGEKYMHTLLQVEIMLKIWFPQVAPCAPTSLSQNSTSSPPPHQHQLPVKVKLFFVTYINSCYWIPVLHSSLQYNLCV
uniref:Circadian associated repressor of transcription a n=1 Tax=Electrophorus electricus TaxID=8005 RepID=A0AAY5EES6_ELEEL